jgi:hypothetical protein
MELEAYRAFTLELVRALEPEARVRGLVALGSMAERDSAPDTFSDHDFFVVVETGTQESFRSNLSWLPRAQELALTFRETAHGLKAVYDSGHLLEFAVFDLEELYLARVNRYRVLLDRGDVARRLEEIAARTTQEAARTAPDDAWLLGQLLTQVLVGTGRYARGEVLSGRARLADAVRLLCILLARHVRAPREGLLDGLDPLRRVERVYPTLGAELARASEGDTLGLARTLLGITVRELAQVPGFSRRGVDAVLASVNAAAGMARTGAPLGVATGQQSGRSPGMSAAAVRPTSPAAGRSEG